MSDPAPTGGEFFSDPAAPSSQFDVVADLAGDIRGATSEEQDQLTKDNYVTVSVVRAGETIADTTYQLKTKKRQVMEKKGKEFEQIICSTDKGDQCCWIYVGKITRTCYWTWTLDFERKGKLKSM